MTTVATSIPDNLNLNLNLNLHRGEEIQFHAVVQQEGSFLVTCALHRQPPLASRVPVALSDVPRTLSEWAHKWAGTLHLAEDGQSSAYDLMKDGFGCVDSGLTDLASNPKRLEGLGRWRS